MIRLASILFLCFALRACVTLDPRVIITDRDGALILDTLDPATPICRP